MPILGCYSMDKKYHKLKLQLRCSDSWISSNFGSDLVAWTNCGKAAMFDGDSLDLAKISLDMAIISPDLSKISPYMWINKKIDAPSWINLKCEIAFIYLFIYF